MGGKERLSHPLARCSLAARPARAALLSPPCGSLLCGTPVFQRCPPPLFLCSFIRCIMISRHARKGSGQGARRAQSGSNCTPVAYSTGAPPLSPPSRACQPGADWWWSRHLWEGAAREGSQEEAR